jgi:hypothetical protein
MLVFVEQRTMGRLGSDPSAPFVVSHRSNQEKEPWKSLPSIDSRVEASFIYPILLGESILPYQVFRVFEGVLPITPEGEVLNADAAANRGLEGLFGWMRKAEAVWEENKRSKNMTLVERFNYYKLLSAQFPIPKLRVVYAKAGSQPAACILRDENHIIENLLYWSEVTSEEEALYLCAILNSETVRSRIEASQNRGQWGARHFDKLMFNLPIPRFEAKNRLHRALGEAASEAEKIAAAVELPENVRFQRARGLVRAALTEAGLSQKIDGLVARLLDGG